MLHHRPVDPGLESGNGKLKSGGLLSIHFFISFLTLVIIYATESDV